MVLHWPIKSKKNFPRNHAVSRLFFLNCSGNEVGFYLILIKSAPVELVTRSQFFLFFNLQLVTRRQKNKSLTTEIKVKLSIFLLRISNSKCYSFFFKFELLTRRWNKKSLTNDFVTRSTFFIFWLRVNNSKCNFLFLDFELITWSVKFYFSTSS